MGSDGITYTGVEALNVFLGGEADVFTVESTHADTTTIVESRAGDDEVGVRTVSGATSVATGDGSDTVHVGDTDGRLEGILASLTVDGGNGEIDRLDVDDSGDATASSGVLSAADGFIALNRDGTGLLDGTDVLNGGLGHDLIGGDNAPVAIVDVGVDDGPHRTNVDPVTVDLPDGMATGSLQGDLDLSDDLVSGGGGDDIVSGDELRAVRAVVAAGPLARSPISRVDIPVVHFSLTGGESAVIWTMGPPLLSTSYFTTQELESILRVAALEFAVAHTGRDGSVGPGHNSPVSVRWCTASAA